MASNSKQVLEQLKGAYCPLVVPFADGKIDFDTYGKLIERQIEEGTHGLLVNATSGEPTMLSREERASTVEFAINPALFGGPTYRACSALYVGEFCTSPCCSPSETTRRTSSSS